MYLPQQTPSPKWKTIKPPPAPCLRPAAACRAPRISPPMTPLVDAIPQPPSLDRLLPITTAAKRYIPPCPAKYFPSLVPHARTARTRRTHRRLAFIFFFRALPTHIVDTVAPLARVTQSQDLCATQALQGGQRGSKRAEKETARALHTSPACATWPGRSRGLHEETFAGSACSFGDEGNERALGRGRFCEAVCASQAVRGVCAVWVRGPP